MQEYFINFVGKERLFNKEYYQIYSGFTHLELKQNRFFVLIDENNIIDELTNFINQYNPKIIYISLLTIEKFIVLLPILKKYKTIKFVLGGFFTIPYELDLQNCFPNIEIYKIDINIDKLLDGKYNLYTNLFWEKSKNIVSSIKYSNENLFVPLTFNLPCYHKKCLFCTEQYINRDFSYPFEENIDFIFRESKYKNYILISPAFNKKQLQYLLEYPKYKEKQFSLYLRLDNFILEFLKNYDIDNLFLKFGIEFLSQKEIDIVNKKIKLENFFELLKLQKRIFGYALFIFSNFIRDKEIYKEINQNLNILKILFFRKDLIFLATPYFYLYSIKHKNDFFNQLKDEYKNKIEIDYIQNINIPCFKKDKLFFLKEQNQKLKNRMIEIIKNKSNLQITYNYFSHDKPVA